jgi:hypothetical protein
VAKKQVGGEKENVDISDKSVAASASLGGTPYSRSNRHLSRQSSARKKKSLH